MTSISHEGMRAFRIPYRAINVVTLPIVKFKTVLKFYDNSLLYLHTKLFFFFLLRYLFCQLSRGMCVEVIQVSFFRTMLMYFAVSFCCICNWCKYLSASITLLKKIR